MLAPYVGIPLLTIAIGCGLSYWIYADGRDRPGAKLFVGVLPTQHLRMALPVVHVLSIDPTVRGSASRSNPAPRSSRSRPGSSSSRCTPTRRTTATGSSGRVSASVGGIAVLAVTGPFHDYPYAELPIASEPFARVGPEYGSGLLAIASPSSSCWSSYVVPVGYGYVVLVRHQLSTQRRTGALFPRLLATAISIDPTDATVIPDREVGRRATI